MEITKAMVEKALSIYWSKRGTKEGMRSALKNFMEDSMAYKTPEELIQIRITKIEEEQRKLQSQLLELEVLLTSLATQADELASKIDPSIQ